jgi:hypothetical protein
VILWIAAWVAVQDEAAVWSAVDERVRPLWIGKTDPAPFQAPPDEEREALAAFAAAAPEAGLPARLKAAGWALEELPFGTEKLHLLRESPEARRGRGFMLVRPRGAKLVLMAPHRFFDRHTGELARGLFFRSKASVLLENTAHRHWARPDGAEYGPSDAAHSETTGLHALARGLATGGPGLLFVQLHGFDEDAASYAILSDGTRTPSEAARKAAGALRAASLDCRLYGVEATRLGGTGNVLGRHLRASGSDDRFLHLEMSRPLRESLQSAPAALADVLRTLAD